MSWFKVDDSFPQHRKVLMIPRKHRLACIGLWMSGAAWCSRHLSDGLLDKFLIDELGGTEELADWLIKVGLWIDKNDQVLFHDWSDYQSTRSQVDEKKAKDAERKRKAREAYEAKRARSKDSVQKDSEDVTTESARSPSGQSTESAQRPERVRVTETETPTEAPTPTATEAPTETEVSTKSITPAPTSQGVSKRKSYPISFEEFWKIFPRSEEKASAGAAWEKAVKAAGTVEVIIQGLRRYLADPNQVDVQYMPYAVRWLKNQRWNDGPCPQRVDRRPTQDENVASWESLKSESRPRAVES